MIAVVFEDIVVFILDFPSGTTCGDNFQDIVFVNGVRCRPGIAVDKLLFGIGDSDFAPVHIEAFGVAKAQWFTDKANYLISCSPAMVYSKPLSIYSRSL